MRILLASSIDPAAIESLETDHDVVCAFNASEDRLAELVRDRDVLVFRSGVTVSAQVLEQARHLRLLLRAGSGLDNVDLAATERLGMQLVRVPGSSAQPVAELTFALLLSLVRKVTLADSLLRRGHWPKSKLGGPLLTGKTIGIVGAGRIGSRVGEMAAAWGMRALGCVDRPSAAIAGSLGARGIEMTDFETVLGQSDFLSLHVPLTDDTHHLIDADVLARVKPGSFLVNMARGGVVDEKALHVELSADDGRLLGAALDVHEAEGEGVISPLAELPNVVLTPHIGAMAWDAQRLIGERLLELLRAHEAGGLDPLLTPDERVTASAGTDPAGTTP